MRIAFFEIHEWESRHFRWISSPLAVPPDRPKEVRMS